MDLETKMSLWDGDKKVAEQGDKIKITLNTGEVLIGHYDYSDISTLTVDREDTQWEFYLEDIEEIKVIQNK